MENIFYAVLAVHIAGKPVNKKNILAVLEAADTPVDGLALDAMAAFVESLEAARQEKERAVDPRIIDFLTSELARREVQTRQLQALLQRLSQPVPPSPDAIEAPSPGPEEPADSRETPAISDEPHHEEAVWPEAEPAVSVPAEEFAVGAQGKGRYVYGIAAGGREAGLGRIGIESAEVYTIPYKDLCAIVHNCPAAPYQSDEDEIVKGWVKAHQIVLDEAGEQFGTLIPSGFDTILQPQDDSTFPNQVVRDWLKEDYDRLCTVMEKIKGKDEYGVQISYEARVIGEQISEQSVEVRKIKEEMATKSSGMAYMYRQKLEKAVKAEVERFADDWFHDFHNRIKQHSDDIVVEQTKKIGKDMVMLLNLSCLVTKGKVDSLGEELERINSMEGFSVHFSGPWPPYSFVAKPVLPAKEEAK